MEPLERKSDIEPDALVSRLQEILFPADVLIIMSEPRLKNAFGQVLTLKERQMPQLKARDTRSLIKVKETQTMLLSAEMTLKAALMRKETRENIFYREDFPGPDNLNWLKWIVVHKGKNDEMDFETRDISFETYRFRPELQNNAGDCRV